MINNPFIALVIAFGLVAGCASVEKSEQERHALETEPVDTAINELGYIKGDPVKQVNDWNLYNWRAVNPQAAIIWTGINRPYLFTLQRRCNNLMFAETIGLTNTASTVRAGLDAIVVPNPPTGPERCFITDIYPLTKVDTSPDDKKTEES
ncbi:MAG: DUF6491 family protein [Pseudomonadota bacterium]